MLPSISGQCWTEGEEKVEGGEGDNRMYQSVKMVTDKLSIMALFQLREDGIGLLLLCIHSHCSIYHLSP